MTKISSTLTKTCRALGALLLMAVCAAAPGWAVVAAAPAADPSVHPSTPAAGQAGDCGTCLVVAQGMDTQGMDTQGMSREGIDDTEFDQGGVDSGGMDTEGMTRQGIDESEFDQGGMDNDGMDSGSMDKSGLISGRTDGSSSE